MNISRTKIHKLESLKTDIARCVLKQLKTDKEEFVRSMTSDIVNYGADTGWNGFIYYSDTTEFFEKNEKVIKQRVYELEKEYGCNYEDLFKDSDQRMCVRCALMDYGDEEDRIAGYNLIAMSMLSDVAYSVINEIEQLEE